MVREYRELLNFLKEQIQDESRIVLIPRVSKVGSGYVESAKFEGKRRVKNKPRVRRNKKSRWPKFFKKARRFLLVFFVSSFFHGDDDIKSHKATPRKSEEEYRVLFSSEVGGRKTHFEINGKVKYE